MTFIYNFVIMYKLSKNRGVAQLVARSVRDAEVVGSIPVASTKKYGETLRLHCIFLSSATVARNHVLAWVRALSLRFGEAKKRPNIMAENKRKSSSAFRSPALWADPQHAKRFY